MLKQKEVNTNKVIDVSLDMQVHHQEDIWLKKQDDSANLDIENIFFKQLLKKNKNLNHM